MAMFVIFIGGFSWQTLELPKDIPTNPSVMS